MKHGRILCFGLFFVGVLSVSAGARAQSGPKTPPGTISGVVRDAGGIPQLGATVEVIPEHPGIFESHRFLTNTQGLFRGENLLPGFYTVEVTLAGFLPSLEKHVQISSNLTTVVRVQLESLFASLDELRRPPTGGSAEPDDWKWVLRSASGMRPILEWHEEQTDQSAAVVGETGQRGRLGIVDLSGGARRPGSVTNIDGAPGTAFAYDQRLDGSNHLVFAGQVSYDEDAPAGGLAAVWLPTGMIDSGPHSTMVMRESRIGPDGPLFRGVRIDEGGTVTLGDRFVLRMGGEYVLVGVGPSAWSVRPRLDWQSQLAPGWYVDVIYAALPTGTNTEGDSINALADSQPRNVLATALDELDAFPALMWHRGKPVIEDGRHQEIAVEHKVSERGIVQIAAFHDNISQDALFGKGTGLLPATDYFEDFYSKAFAYDGGMSNSWGSRVALRERITDDLDLTAIYAFSGALAPVLGSDGALRDLLRTVPFQSATLKLAGKVPVTRTRLSAGYKWVSGPALGRVDPYGEAVYDTSPYLSVGLHQPLPWVPLGRWEANAQCDNLLAQGYIPINMRDGQVLLVPAFRAFRGGLTLQF